MQAAIVTKRFIVCPSCREPSFSIEHMFSSVPHRFGPWRCDQYTDVRRVIPCRGSISGIAYPDGEVEITVSEITKPDGIALFKLRDLFFTMSERYGRVGSDEVDFLYHSHQCPTNLLHRMDEIFGPSGDSDVHGMIRFVANIDDTPETRQALKHASLREVLEVFHTDGEPIKTEWPEEDEGIVPFIARWRRKLS